MGPYCTTKNNVILDPLDIDIKWGISTKTEICVPMGAKKQHQQNKSI